MRLLSCSTHFPLFGVRVRWLIASIRLFEHKVIRSDRMGSGRETVDPFPTLDFDPELLAGHPRLCYCVPSLPGDGHSSTFKGPRHGRYFSDIPERAMLLDRGPGFGTRPTERGAHIGFTTTRSRKSILVLTPLISTTTSAAHFMPCTLPSIMIIGDRPGHFLVPFY